MISNFVHTALCSVTLYFRRRGCLDNVLMMFSIEINGLYGILSCISVVTICLCNQVVDKVKMQMDSFLEDGSHEATIAVIRALSVAIPLTTSNLRDYILFATFKNYLPGCQGCIKYVSMGYL